MANNRLRKLWVTLQTQEWPEGGTDANFRLRFEEGGSEIHLPDQPGADLEQGDSTTFEFSVRDLTIQDFRHDKIVHLVSDLSGDNPSWRCKSVLILGLGENGKFYPFCAMSDVDTWVNSANPMLRLDLLRRPEVGVPAA